ncbi:MAG: carbon starvation protein A, partial [Planctomycetes bacterium]|nr:carbon starvation protein A [Planctomycetota bacterium]
WPLFGATNQLLAALALLVVTVYLARKGKPLGYTLIPFLLMLVMTGWAMLCNIRMFYNTLDSASPQIYPLVISIIIMALEVWMVIEAALAMVKTRKVSQAS